MKLKFKINKANLMYIPKKVTEEGFKGEVEALANTFSIVMCRPFASRKDIVTSLKGTLKLIEAEMKPLKYVFQKERGMNPKFPRRFVGSIVFIRTFSGELIKHTITGIKGNKFILKSGKYFGFRRIKRIGFF